MLRLLAFVLLVLQLACYVLLQGEIVEHRKDYRTSDKLLLIADRPEVTKAMSLGFDNLVSDLMWIRGIQYFGGNFSTLHDPEKKAGFTNLFEAIVTLDPQFEAAWKFGGFALNEACLDPESAVSFLSRGAEAIPDDWELMFDAGFITFFTMKDEGHFDRAKALFETAAARPGAPEHVRRMAIEMDYAAGRFMAAWNQYSIYADEAEKKGDEVSYKIASEKLDMIYLEEVRGHIDNAITLYREEHDGEYPNPNLLDLLGAGTAEDPGPLGRVAIEAIQDASEQIRVFDVLTDGTGDPRYLLMDRIRKSPIVMWLRTSGTQTVVQIDSRASLLLLQQENLTFLQQFTEHYENQEPGLPLNNLDEMVAQEWYREEGLPPDPLGGEYYYDSNDKKVKVRNMKW